MTFGVSSAEKRGQMWLFSSDDMVKWTYEQVLFEHPDPDVFMLECPDFFPIKDVEGNEKWLSASPPWALSVRLHEPQRQQRRLHDRHLDSG